MRVGTSRWALLSVVAIVWGALGLGLDEAVPPLKRSVTIAAETGSLSNYLQTIFSSAGISGGIAIVNNQCEDRTENFPEFRGTVQGAFERLATTGHQLHWFDAGGSVVVQNTPAPPLLLKVKVREFQFSRKEPLTKVSSALLDAPEARKQIKELRLVERGPELGFARPQEPTTPQDIVTLTDTSVLDALNAIAGHQAVWLYKESACSRHEVSLNWVVR